MSFLFSPLFSLRATTRVVPIRRNIGIDRACTPIYIGLFSFSFLIPFWLTKTGRCGFLTAPVPKKGAKSYNFLKLNDPTIYIKEIAKKKIVC